MRINLFRFKMRVGSWTRVAATFSIYFLASSSALAAIPSSERSVLLALYSNTNGPGWTDHSGWMGNSGTECNWYGVVCDGASAHVTQIVLTMNHLAGPLPELADLTALQGMAVTSNQLTGALPSLSNLTNLVIFDASNNLLTGGLPDLSGLVSLSFFDVDNNQISGTIPAFPHVPNLDFFSVDSNHLTGSIPDLSTLSGGITFRVGHNLLSGQVPAYPGNATQSNGSTLCPNNLDLTPGSDDLNWNVVTGYSPWWATPSASNRCDETFASGFE